MTKARTHLDSGNASRRVRMRAWCRSAVWIGASIVTGLGSGDGPCVAGDAVLNPFVKAASDPLTAKNIRKRESESETPAKIPAFDPRPSVYQDNLFSKKRAGSAAGSISSPRANQPERSDQQERTAPPQQRTTRFPAARPAIAQRLPVANGPGQDPPSLNLTMPPLPSPTWNRHAEANQVVAAPTGSETILTESENPLPAAEFDRTTASLSPPEISPRWLASGSSVSDFTEAKDLLDQATSEYGIGAYASATSSAWVVIETCSHALDRESRSLGQSPEATKAVRDAREAISESSEFRQVFVRNDPIAITRLHDAHQTPQVCDIEIRPESSATEVADQYLNFARRKLGSIASRSLDAARALDLLAAITLADRSTNSAARSEAICFRRAAFQGQPGNVVLATQLGQQLAHAGLFDEAQLALEHSMSLRPSADASRTLSAVLATRGDRAGSQHYAALAGQLPSTKRDPDVPEIVSVSPQAFAALSSPLIHATAPIHTSVAADAIARVDPSQPSPRVASHRVPEAPSRASRGTVPESTADRRFSLGQPFVPANGPEAANLVVGIPVGPTTTDNATDERRGKRPNPVRRVFDSLGRLW